MSFAVSQPFMNDPRFASQFYEALGRMFVVWDRFEHLFDRQLIYLISEAKKRGKLIWPIRVLDPLAKRHLGIRARHAPAGQTPTGSKTSRGRRESFVRRRSRSRTY
jgi:hypothetical protein